MNLADQAVTVGHSAIHPGPGRVRIGGAPKEAAEHMSVQGAINVIGNDLRQLQEEIGELRARLSPILAEHEGLVPPHEGLPVRCKMAAELCDILAVVKECRNMVNSTMLQLDI